MIRVVTLGGEYGSGRAEIARIVADRLGWRLIDSCLIEDIARLAHLDPAMCRKYDEVTDPWFHRLRKALWQGGYEGVVTTTESTLDAGAIAEAAHRVILEAAKAGKCVIVGRGGQCVLQNFAEAFHVFVYAPREDRLARIRRREPNQDAEMKADLWDRRRAAYIRQYFGQDWTNRHLYGLMVCSSIGEEASAAVVLTAIEQQNK